MFEKEQGRVILLILIFRFLKIFSVSVSIFKIIDAYIYMPGKRE